MIDKPDAGQAAVFLARTGINRKDPDYFRGIVSNSVLSGYSGRLNQEIRIKRGLSYGAASTLDTRRDVGPFVASAQTKNESGAQVADLLLGEISRLSSIAAGGCGVDAAQGSADRKLLAKSRDCRRARGPGRFARALRTGARRDQSLHQQRAGNHALRIFRSLPVRGWMRKRATSLSSATRKLFLPELQKKYPNVEVIPIGDLDLNTALLQEEEAG